MSQLIHAAAILWVETNVAAEHLLTHRAWVPTKNYLAPNVDKVRRLKDPGTDMGIQRHLVPPQ